MREVKDRQLLRLSELCEYCSGIHVWQLMILEAEIAVFIRVNARMASLTGMVTVFICLHPTLRAAEQIRSTSSLLSKAKPPSTLPRPQDLLFSAMAFDSVLTSTRS
jgi:hypothetical protein